MIRTHYRKKCPYCGKMLESGTYYGTERIRFGSPFFCCPHCNQEFIDHELKELALQPYSKKLPDMWYRILGQLPLVILGIIIILESLISGDPLAFFPMGVGVALVAVGAIIIAYPYSHKDELQERYRARWEESHARLSDPHYAYKLNRNGFQVPEEYLEEVAKIYGVETLRVPPTTYTYEEYLEACKAMKLGRSSKAIKEIAERKGMAWQELVDHYETVIKTFNEQMRSFGYFQNEDYHKLFDYYDGLFRD